MNFRSVSSIMVLGLFVATAGSAKDLAKVNGRQVTDKDLKQALGAFNEGQRENILKDLNSRRMVLNNAIDQELLAQKGEELKLDQEAEFKEMTANFRKQLLANMVLQKKLATNMTPAQLKKYYDLHEPKYSTDQVHVQHILASSEEEARKFLKMAQEEGADFQKIAEQHSKDPSAKNNRGDLGFVTRDLFVEDFTDPVFIAKTGSIIGPIKTLYGYHIVKVLDRKAGKHQEYSEVELRVRQALQQELGRKYALELRKEAKLEINEAALKSN